MHMQLKADLASAFTVVLSGIAFAFHALNGWVTEFMPLITTLGIVSSFTLTAWYYRKTIEQKRRDRALEHKRMDHEVWLEERRSTKRREEDQDHAD